MVSRSRSGLTELQAYIQASEREIAVLTKLSSKELIAATMEIEMERLEEFVKKAATAADAILETRLITNLVVEASYFPPPLARPRIKMRPDDAFFTRIAPKYLLSQPQFDSSWVIPGHDNCAGLELTIELITPYARDIRSTIDVEFKVNYMQTIQAFRWLFQEWRRPLCQLLRSLPNLELWGNGIMLDPPKGSHTKDPAILLEMHLNTQHERRDDNLVSFRRSFSADDIDMDVTLTLGVFLALFDAIYCLTEERANPDRLLRHYECLISKLPNAPFRKASIFGTDGS